MRRLAFVVAVAVVLVPFPTQAAEDVIFSGADLWKTTQDGLTHTQFAQDPIPAGFFCPESPPFDRQISFTGVPLPAEPEGALEEYDTIVHRLDDANFDADGEAVTRVRLLALWLRSLEPVDVGCDRAYDVDVVLDGEQPTTKMRIVRETENGGFYVSPLALNVKVRFTPVDGTVSERLEVKRRIELGPGTRSVWSYQDGDRGLLAKVDTDGDGEIDTLVPTRGNFRAGVSPAALNSATTSSLCPYRTCHCTEGSTDPFEDASHCTHLHCQDVLVNCCELQLRTGISTWESEKAAAEPCRILSPSL
jgi:hypothetical protein